MSTKPGVALYLACDAASSVTGTAMLKSADPQVGSRFIANQAYYSLVGRNYELELMPLGRDQGLGAIVWTPLPDHSRLHEIAGFAPSVDDEPLVPDRRCARQHRRRDG